MPHILLPLLSALPRFHGFLNTVWCDFPAVTHTLMDPRRFVPVRRSQSLFEELKFGRSLALAKVGRVKTHKAIRHFSNL